MRGKGSTKGKENVWKKRERKERENNKRKEMEKENKGKEKLKERGQDFFSS